MLYTFSQQPQCRAVPPLNKHDTVRPLEQRRLAYSGDRVIRSTDVSVEDMHGDRHEDLGSLPVFLACTRDVPGSNPGRDTG
jgi:hypothetical protein